MITKDKLLKIQELAKNGRDGEREAAQRVLARWLDQLELTEADIDIELTDEYSFCYKTEMESRLLRQIYGAVVGSETMMYWRVKGKRKLIFEVTESQADEIRSLFAIYKKPLEKELDKCYKAFLFLNDLTVKTKEPAKLSPEQKDELAQLARMMLGMDKADRSIPKQFRLGDGR